MVLKRTNLANIYKKRHLRSSFKGEAAKLIDEIPPAGEHFEDAWSTIKSFYDNPSLLISRHAANWQAARIQRYDVQTRLMR